MINSLFWLNGPSAWAFYHVFTKYCLRNLMPFGNPDQLSYSLHAKGCITSRLSCLAVAASPVGLVAGQEGAFCAVMPMGWKEMLIPGLWFQKTAHLHLLWNAPLRGSSFLVSGRTTVATDGKQHWMLPVIWGTPATSPSPPATRDVTEKVPIISTVVGGKWALIAAGDLVVLGCQHAFFHIGLLLQGLMLADYNSVASHFRFIWTYFSSLLSFHWLTSIQTHCNSSESLSSSDGSIYEKFS